jgi:NADH-quinone oxidoreductase subunit K
MIGVGHYLAVSAILFTLGVLGIFNLIAFAQALGDMVGQVFAMFVLTVAAGEAAIGLAILVIYFRGRGTIAVDDANRMKG